MKKWVIFQEHAIAKTLINQVVIDLEGCDKHEIEAFVKSFNFVCLKTNFSKFSISSSFKIFLKFEFLKKPTFLKFSKIHQNCSLSWPHIQKVSFWDLNVENLVHLTWNDSLEKRKWLDLAQNLIQ
jgi:uncharacterized protein YfkK (UPF0435 family)